MPDYEELIACQRQFFASQRTKNLDFRIQELKRLKNVLEQNETYLYQEIYKDFKKSDHETYLTELSLLSKEISLAISKTKRWAQKRKVSTSIVNWPSKGYILPEPLGISLIIGAWNYPYQLSLAPAIAAIAAGCTIILKPSEIAPHSSAAMAKLINENFDPAYFHVVEGGVEETTSLLKVKFDKIFFTGSVSVGKIIHKAAAEHLTPTTLELGGKSPAIIMGDADIKITAKRLVWAKFLNAGQTCIAPDYVMLHSSCKSEFLTELKAQIEKANYDVSNKNYTQIVNDKNFDRLQKLIDPEKICYGGKTDAATRVIHPTILTQVTFEDAVMQEEIFGPILPIISFDDLSNTIQQINQLPKPLSCYIFTKSKDIRKRILSEISFGGGTINDAVMHVSEEHLPFGGVGQSGFGNYHGKAGFETFSHFKSILQKSFLLELDLKYPPYSSSKMKWLKRLMKFY